MSKTADGKDGTEKVMAVPPYTQETCYALSSFQAPHEPQYEQPMFKLGYGGYVLCTMDDMTVIKLGHRTTLREHLTKVAELVVKSQKLVS